MKTAIAYSTAILLALSTSACGSLMNPDIQQNPHPKMRYDITMTIEDPPGPFGSVTGFIQYEVTNKNCVPEDPLAGVTVAPSTNPAFTFTRVSNNVYTTTVYADLMKDEDYYGKGVCHWAMTAVVGELNVHSITFSPDIDSAEITSHTASTRYFWKEFYQRTDLQDFSDPGVPYSVYSTADDRNKYFTITMTAKERFE